MKDITIPGKMELVRQVRSTYNKNMYDMSNREKLLYGKTTQRDYDLITTENIGEEFDKTNTSPNSRGWFIIRLFTSVFLFLLIISMDSKGSKLLGLSSGDIREAIASDYVDTIDTWISNGLQVP